MAFSPELFCFNSGFQHFLLQNFVYLIDLKIRIRSFCLPKMFRFMVILATKQFELEGVVMAEVTVELFG